MCTTTRVFATIRNLISKASMSKTASNFRQKCIVHGVELTSMSMSAGVSYSISLTEKIKEISAVHPGLSVGLFIRHANRPVDNDSSEVPITKEGEINAQNLGSSLGGIAKPGQILVSPLLRCFQTAKHIAIGAGWNASLIATAPQLIGIGTVCCDVDLATKSVAERGFVNCVNTWIHGDVPLGFRSVQDGTDLMFDFIKSTLSTPNPTGDPILHVFVSHDNMMALMVHKFFAVNYFDDSNWPQFLESVMFVKSDDQFHVHWRDMCTTIA